MGALAARDDILALSLHVDYWDYIGWKDEFAHPGNAQRQRSYAMVAGRKSVYTPEMIVNGVSDVAGAKPIKLMSAIDKHKNAPKMVSLKLTRVSAGQISISAKPLADGLGTMNLQLLRYRPTRVSRISRGENAGRTITYVNVTQDWQIVGRWDGRSPVDLRVDAAGELPIVVLVQSENYGPIRAAAELK